MQTWILRVSCQEYKCLSEFIISFFFLSGCSVGCDLLLEIAPVSSHFMQSHTDVIHCLLLEFRKVYRF